MNSQCSLRHLEEAEWKVAVRDFTDLSHRQCWAYAIEAAKDVGASAEFVGVFDGSELIGLANVRIKKIPFLSLGMAYVSHGPLTRRDHTFSPQLFAACVGALQQHYVRRRKLLLRIVAPVGGAIHTSGQVETLGALGFRPAEGVKPQESFVLDLDRDLPSIRRSFDKKWSASLTRAEKCGVGITSTQDPADFARFEQLYGELVERKGFFARQDAAFFSRVNRQADSADHLELHLAWHEGELVAGHLGNFAGDTAIMILAAANAKGRDVCASFALQWAVIQRAMALRQRFYDLGGIDQAANPDVYRFKKRMNGRLVEAPPYEVAPSHARKAAMDLIERAWGHVRAARRRGVLKPA